MKLSSTLMLSLLSAGLSFSANANSDTANQAYRGQNAWDRTDLLQPPQVDGLLVDFDDRMNQEDLAALGEEMGVTLERSFGVYVGNRVVVKGPPSLLERLKTRLAGRGDVESVEDNIFYRAIDEPGAGSEAVNLPEPTAGTRPNDPMYKHQWHFDMVNAEEAWERAKGDGVIVAVIDTGVSPGKINGKKSRFKRVPDLKDTEFVPGYNFVDRKPDPSDGNGHGTHVAGTIAQSTNNGFGVAGLAPKAKIMPIKVLSDRGWGSVGAISAGIRFAADNGAHVINMSLGGGGYSASLAKAVKYAHDKGVIVICAAGNGGRERVEFPAAYPGAMAVSALGPDERLAFYSSYGEQLSIAAPGGDTRVDLNKDGIPDGVLQDTIARGDPSKHGFFPFQGTSMATPHVAAAAALVISTGVTDPDRVREILEDSATDLDDPVRYGAGSLNAAGAVKRAQRASGAGGLFCALVLAAGLFVKRRKRFGQAAHLVSAPFFATLMMSASGLFFIREMVSADCFLTELLARPLLDWPALLSPSFHLTWLLGSVALPLAAVSLLLGVQRLRGALVGLCIGTAGYLLARSFLGDVNVLGIPGHGFLDSAWLFAQSALTLTLAWIVSKPDHLAR